MLLVVGRNKSENERLANLNMDDDVLLKVADRPGPLALIRAMHNNLKPEDLKLAASIVARYSDAKNEKQARIKVFSEKNDSMDIMLIKPLAAEEVPASV